MVPNGHDIIVSKHSSSGFVSCKFPKNDELTKHIMIQLSLPPELKHGIVKLSPPNTLASLARTHPALQVVAEQALYLSLHNPVLKCLETLATNSEKAGFVRFLTMDIYYYENNPDGLNWEPAMISYLLNALVNMHSLSDLRMRLSPIKSWSESLDNILWSVYELGSFDLLKITAGDTVTFMQVFDYKLCTAMQISTFLESSRVKPSCRYLEYTIITAMKPGFWQLSNNFRVPTLNYTSQ